MRQVWRGWRAVTWQVGKDWGAGSEDVAMWETCHGSEVARWER